MYTGICHCGVGLKKGKDYVLNFQDKVGVETTVRPYWSIPLGTVDTIPVASPTATNPLIARLLSVTPDSACQWAASSLTIYVCRHNF